MARVDKTSPSKFSICAKLKRISLVAVPAGVITVSLFTAMHQLVAVDDFMAPELTTYQLPPYMEVEPIEPPEQAERRIVKLDPINPPPKTPSLAKDLSDVDVPISGYKGIAPADYGQAEFNPILPTRVSAIRMRTLTPVTPPIPTYPSAAEKLGLEGDCEVFFSVSVRGEPFDVQAQCSDRKFEKSARKAVQKVKFVPQIRDGLPVTVTGVVYPLEFRMKH